MEWFQLLCVNMLTCRTKMVHDKYLRDICDHDDEFSSASEADFSTDFTDLSLGSFWIFYLMEIN